MFEVGEVHLKVNLRDLVKSFPTSIWLRKLASILPRRSPLKFAQRQLDIKHIEFGHT